VSECGHPVVFLYPSQVWMAVETQTPYLRYAGMSYTRGGEADFK